jgi:DNA polymerase I-like protein with 3'-5' exonuclease and polymerase domains
MREARAVGRVDAPYLFVLTSRPSEGMLAWFWKILHAAGIQKADARLVFMIDEAPAGASNNPLKSQLRSAQARFEREVRQSTAQVVMPLGTDAFRVLTGINEGTFDARGYVIRKDLFHLTPSEEYIEVGKYVNASKVSGAKKGDPKMKWVTSANGPLLGMDFPGVIIPSFGLEYVRKKGFAVAPAFIEDVKRAKRANDGELREVDAGFKFVTAIKQLPSMKKLGEVVAVDIETHGIDNEVIDLVSFSDGDTTAVLEWCAPARDYLTRLFATDRMFAMHNSPFDLPRLLANGVRISQDVIDKRLFDTMFAAVVLQPDLHKALGRVASLYLDVSPWKTSARKDSSHWRALVLADPKRYAGKDAFITSWIAVQEMRVMQGMGCWDLFMGRGSFPGPGVMATLPTLSEMSRAGIRTNKPYAVVLCGRLERRLLRYLKLWLRMFPTVKVSSNPQLQKLFYKEWGLPFQRSKEDGITVDELALVKLGAFVGLNQDEELLPGAWRTDPRACPRTFELLLKIRECSKMLGTYVQPVMFSEETWVHPSYLPASKDDEEGKNQSGEMHSKGNTATGRLSSYKPNIQNQPKKMRVLYVPDRDDMCFIQADYKSAELQALMAMSGDQQLRADLQGDIYQLNADRLGIARKTAKNVLLASVYLAGPAKQSEMILRQEHTYISVADCLTISRDIWSQYTNATAYKDLLVELCKQKKYITNPFGRTRFFHSGAGPAAVDFIPQSIVADVLWCVLKPAADMARRYGGRITTTVHDSILIQVPQAALFDACREIKEIMEQRFDCVSPGFLIPVEVEWAEAGQPWSEVKAHA